MNRSKTTAPDGAGTSPAPIRRRAARARTVPLAAAVLAAVTPFALAGTASASSAAPAARGPVTAQWTTQTVARGVQVRTGTIRDTAAAPSWTVTVQAPATSRLTGAATWAEVGAQSWADSTAARLRTAGFTPRTETVRWPDYTDTPHGTMGLRVRIGSYADQAAAQAAAATVTAAGFHAVAEWTGYDAQQPADVENIHVAVIDPRTFTGTVEGTHDGDVAQRETTSSVAAKLGSLVGVNAGFFVTADADGVQGIQSGIAAYDGELESMASGSRAALIIGDGGRQVRVADLTSTVTARAGASTYAVQGINRVPGTVRDCGRPGLTPSALPWQDVTCHTTDDLVRFTSAFGADLPTGAGTQVVLDAAGRVVSTGARGGRVPAGGTVLQGIGTAAAWLDAHATAGQRVQVSEEVRDTAGRRVPLGKGDSIVSAAPTLVKDGRVSIDAASEGTVDPSDLSFGYAWANTRQPRTLAGVDAKGRLLLVTVDGRLSGGSEGFTLQEGAAFMRSLGAVQALNLDGGGSTAMAVDGRLVNSTSDATGERPVGDTLQILPGRRNS
ncbi:Sporulation related domain-containing protein [Actinacidiphila yanglinensis]|uniref:Sporulation related domain-containing protein n=1 Tax=Actinacidiphila yanglinensis TaxID=310779 RepID=A0A1H5VUN4_9ACTN|nr:phosphodiester glycosidase family protein [Actinacidiphila yanglinensis]SEF90257.1 Sporulation related domain-containing protein [Actinacidiphila yanglinensis]